MALMFQLVWCSLCYFSFSYSHFRFVYSSHVFRLASVMCVAEIKCVKYLTTNDLIIYIHFKCVVQAVNSMFCSSKETLWALFMVHLW